MNRAFFVVLRIILSLLVLACLAVGAFFLYRAGYVNGYNAAAALANSGSRTLSQIPYFSSLAPIPDFGWFIAPLAPLFGVFWFILILMLIGGFFRLLFWHRWDNAPDGYDFHHHHHHRRFGHWSWTWDDQPEQGAAPGPKSSETPAAK